MDQIKHVKDWLLFPKNIGKRLSIDELYTILANISGKDRKETIIAMIARTKADTVNCNPSKKTFKTTKASHENYLE